MRKIITLFLCMIIGMTMFAGCQKDINQFAKPRLGETVAEINVHDYGTIYVRFFNDAAPKAVENFITLAKEGYYDGLSFYRVIEDSIIEGGNPTGTSDGGESIWGEYFKDEFNADLQPYRGALCMVNTGPDTNGSQFFIVQASQTYNDEVLDQIEQSYNINFNVKARKLYGTVGGAPWFYRLNTVFGQVYEGYDVLDRIAKVEKTDDEQGIPAKDVIVEKINIFKYK
ncbi:MAG: peptidylprolyl isomerase [Herbinix sp.]|nr:peptidylprolyl isomerase [Herbinix sp.]